MPLVKWGGQTTGPDTTGFFNTEYFVDLKPREQWRPVLHQNKEELIAAMNRELEKIPGVIWNFSRPIADNMEEAVSGVKGELAAKIYGDDLRTLEDKGNQMVDIMRHVQCIEDLCSSGHARAGSEPPFRLGRAATLRGFCDCPYVQPLLCVGLGKKVEVPTLSY